MRDVLPHLDCVRAPLTLSWELRRKRLCPRKRSTCTDASPRLDRLASLYGSRGFDVLPSRDATPGLDTCLLDRRLPNSERERLLLWDTEQASNCSSSSEFPVLAGNQAIHLRVARRYRTKGAQRPDQAKQREDEKP